MANRPKIFSLPSSLLFALFSTSPFRIHTQATTDEVKARAGGAVRGQASAASARHGLGWPWTGGALPWVVATHYDGPNVANEARGSFSIAKQGG